MESSYDSEVAALHTGPKELTKSRSPAKRTSSEKFSSERLIQFDSGNKDLKMNSKINQLKVIRDRNSMRFPRRDEFSTNLSLAEAEVLELINEYRRPEPTVSMSAKDIGKFTPIKEKTETPSIEEGLQNQEMNEFTSNLMIKLQACQSDKSSN